MSEHDYTPHLSVKIEGVVLPAWLATLATAIFLCSVLSLLVVALVAGPELAKLGREIRVLAIGVGDVENVLIRTGLAHREDFAHPPEPKPDEGDASHVRQPQR